MHKGKTMEPDYFIKQHKQARYMRIICACLLLLLVIGGYLYWQKQFVPSLANATTRIVVVPILGQPGKVVTSVFASAGMPIKVGDPLFAFDASEEHEQLAREKYNLLELEAYVPAAKLRTAVDASALGDVAPLEAQLKIAQQEELAAKEEVEQLSLALAAAKIRQQRLNMGATGGGVSNQQAMAQDEVTAVQAAVGKAQNIFEQKSLRRATIESDMRKITAMQQQRGIADIPENQRVALYSAQAARVQSLQANLNKLTVASPITGVLEAVAPQSAFAATGSAPVVYIRQTESPLVAVGYISQVGASLLTVGQRCLVQVQGIATPYEGIVRGIEPKGTPIAALCGFMPHGAMPTAAMAEPDWEGQNQDQVEPAQQDKEIEVCVSVSASAMQTEGEIAPAAVAGNTPVSVTFPSDL